MIFVKYFSSNMATIWKMRRLFKKLQYENISVIWKFKGGIYNTFFIWPVKVEKNGSKAQQFLVFQAIYSFKIISSAFKDTRLVSF